MLLRAECNILSYEYLGLINGNLVLFNAGDKIIDEELLCNADLAGE